MFKLCVSEQENGLRHHRKTWPKTRIPSPEVKKVALPQQSLPLMAGKYSPCLDTNGKQLMCGQFVQSTPVNMYIHTYIYKLYIYIHITSYYIILHYITLCFIILHYITLYYIMLYNIILYHIILYCILSYCIILEYNIKLCHIILE